MMTIELELRGEGGESGAAEIAAHWGNDGQNWRSPEGVDLIEYCRQVCRYHRTRNVDGPCCEVRYVFFDGSSLIARAGGWDLPLSTNEDCWCLEGDRFHQERCFLNPRTEHDDGLRVRIDHDFRTDYVDADVTLEIWIERNRSPVKGAILCGIGMNYDDDWTVGEFTPEQAELLRSAHLRDVALDLLAEVRGARP